MTPTPDALRAATRAIIDLRAAIVVRIMRVQDQPVADGDPPPLSPAQHLTLSVLTDRPRSVGEIAEQTGVSASTTTRMLQGLSRRGLIEDAEVPDDDRRRRYVTLTPLGREAAITKAEQITARIQELLSGLSPDEVDALLRGIQVFEVALERSGARQVPSETGDPADPSRSSAT